MTHFATALHYLIPPLACIGAICVASWAAVAALVYRETRNARHDAEDAAVFGPREVYGPLPGPHASDEEWDDWDRRVVGLKRWEIANQPPLEWPGAVTALRAELEDESAIERWLSA